MQDIFSNGQWLPLTFAFLMILSMFFYTVLDGYDIGVGILSRFATDQERDTMIASIGPFWDANETWLVLGVGLLLVAFPSAHGIVLGGLYLPVALMLLGLILRGVAFDFRVKARPEKRAMWNRLFFWGSLIMALSQGYMLGSYILGFERSLTSALFALLVAVCVVAGYSLMGACWLVMKTEGGLQKRAVDWARKNLLGTGVGIVAVSVATPLTSARIFAKWFSFPDFFYIAPVPALTAALAVSLALLLKKLPMEGDRLCWAPFASAVGIFMTCFFGLGFSFYPYIVPDQLTIVDAASAHGSLMFILVGALIVLPVLFAYTAFAYKVFWGKTRELSYH